MNKEIQKINNDNNISVKEKLDLVFPDIKPQYKKQLMALCLELQLNPLMKHLALIEGKGKPQICITASGYNHLATKSHRFLTKNKIDIRQNNKGEYECEYTVYACPEGMTSFEYMDMMKHKGFSMSEILDSMAVTDIGTSTNTNTNSMLKGVYQKELAITRARDRAIRKVLNIGIASLDEMYNKEANNVINSDIDMNEYIETEHDVEDEVSKEEISKRRKQFHAFLHQENMDKQEVKRWLRITGFIEDSSNEILSNNKKWKAFVDRKDKFVDSFNEWFKKELEKREIKIGNFYNIFEIDGMVYRIVVNSIEDDKMIVSALYSNKKTAEISSHKKYDMILNKDKKTVMVINVYDVDRDNRKTNLHVIDAMFLEYKDTIGAVLKLEIEIDKKLYREEK